MACEGDSGGILSFQTYILVNIRITLFGGKKAPPAMETPAGL
jgi:hypothetical protein